MARSDKKLIPIPAIDLDGTLVDSAPNIVEAVSRMLRESGAAPLPFETVRGFIGKGVPNLFRRVLEASAVADLGEQPAMALFHRHYRDTNGRIGQVFPGVREVAGDSLAIRWRG